MEKKDLNKSLYQAVKKAMSATHGQKHAVNHIVKDIVDPNMKAQVPKDHIPASSQSVLHKDMSPTEIHSQKQANAQAKLGMPPKSPKMPSTPKMPGMDKNAGAVAGVTAVAKMEKGVHKLAKFMQKCEMKKSKGVHSPSFSNENDKGRSESGDAVRQAGSSRVSKLSSKLMGQVKQSHSDNLKDLKSMPKPNLPK